MALTFVLATLPVVPEGWALLGAATGPLPFGRCVALETSNVFIALVGGDVAVFAVRVRFFQRQGYDAEAAVSACAIATTASWTVKGLLSDRVQRRAESQDDQELGQGRAGQHVDDLVRLGGDRLDVGLDVQQVRADLAGWPASAAWAPGRSVRRRSRRR